MQAYAEAAEAAAQGAPQLPPVNEQNGGETSWGSWEQTKTEVTAYVTLPEGVKPRECNVKFSSTAVKVVVKGQAAPVLDDTLAGAVIADGCFWEIAKVSLPCCGVNRSMPPVGGSAGIGTRAAS